MLSYQFIVLYLFSTSSIVPAKPLAAYRTSPPNFEATDNSILSANGFVTPSANDHKHYSDSPALLVRIKRTGERGYRFRNPANNVTLTRKPVIIASVSNTGIDPDPPVGGSDSNCGAGSYIQVDKAIFNSSTVFYGTGPARTFKPSPSMDRPRRRAYWYMVNQNAL